MFEQREALLRLLSDDDPTTLDLVKQQLSQAGIEALTELRTLLACAPPSAALHLRDVIAEIEERECDSLFAEFCSTFSKHSDLEDAVWRLAATFYPGDNFQSQRSLLDKWGAEVARRLTKAATPLDRVETLSEYLSHEVHLLGNEADYYNIENSLLPNVIDSGLGIPISLSLIYMLVGRRAGLKIDGVCLPGHFLVRHEDIFFDPFHEGRRIRYDECRAIMVQQNLELRPEHLAPAPPLQILIRILTNIFSVAEKTDPSLASKLSGWIDALRAS